MEFFKVFYSTTVVEYFTKRRIVSLKEQQIDKMF